MRACLYEIIPESFVAAYI